MAWTMVEWVVIACVLGLSTGQVFFKMAANAAAQAGSYMVLPVMVWMSAALLIYGVATFAWVWALQRTELGRVYPFTALAFVLVPIASHFIFGERFSTAYFIGVALIVAGLVLVARS